MISSTRRKDKLLAAQYAASSLSLQVYTERGYRNQTRGGDDLLLNFIFGSWL